MVETIRRKVRQNVLEIINIKLADTVCALTMRNAAVLDKEDVITFCRLASECYQHTTYALEVGKLCQKAVTSLENGDEDAYIRYCRDAHLLSQRQPKPLEEPTMDAVV